MAGFDDSGVDLIHVVLSLAVAEEKKGWWN